MRKVDSWLELTFEVLSGKACPVTVFANTKHLASLLPLAR
jgi:hypothetical protein